MPKHMTLLLWYGETPGVHLHRRYGVDTRNKFKDFFGARRDIEEGVWRESNGKVLVGSKALRRMGKAARVLLRHMLATPEMHEEPLVTKVSIMETVDYSALEARVLATERTQSVVRDFALAYGSVQDSEHVTATEVRRAHKRLLGKCNKCSDGLCTQKCLR